MLAMMIFIASQALALEGARVEYSTLEDSQNVYRISKDAVRNEFSYSADGKKDRIVVIRKAGSRKAIVLDTTAKQFFETEDEDFETKLLDVQSQKPITTHFERMGKTSKVAGYDCDFYKWETKEIRTEVCSSARLEKEIKSKGMTWPINKEPTVPGAVLEVIKTEKNKRKNPETAFRVQKLAFENIEDSLFAVPKDYCNKLDSTCADEKNKKK
jgi:hypothetical protein